MENFKPPSRRQLAVYLALIAVAGAAVAGGAGQDSSPVPLTVYMLLAAGAGALVSLKAVPDSTWLQKAVAAALSFLVAVFAGPGLAEWAGVTSPRISAAIVFVVGASGLVAVVALLEGVKQVPFGQLITNFLTFGRSGSSKEGSDK